jgi:selenium donor protein
MLEGFHTHADPRLIVGFDKSDDASVYVLDENTALIQTTDFFPPIVDDPYLYGRIAATNALSDVYAMGGEPKLALNILCAADAMDDATIREILRGGYDTAYEAGAIITGGHTIRGAEPIYGLAVSGFVHPEKVLTNSNAKPGDVLQLKVLRLGDVIELSITLAARPEQPTLTREQQSEFYRLLLLLNPQEKTATVNVPEVRRHMLRLAQMGLADKDEYGSCVLYMVAEKTLIRIKSTERSLTISNNHPEIPDAHLRADHFKRDDERLPEKLTELLLQADYYRP